MISHFRFVLFKEALQKCFSDVTFRRSDAALLWAALWFDFHIFRTHCYQHLMMCCTSGFHVHLRRGSQPSNSDRTLGNKSLSAAAAQVLFFSPVDWWHWSWAAANIFVLIRFQLPAVWGVRGGPVQKTLQTNHEADLSLEFIHLFVFCGRLTGETANFCAGSMKLWFV